MKVFMGVVSEPEIHRQVLCAGFRYKELDPPYEEKFIIIPSFGSKLIHIWRVYILLQGFVRLPTNPEVLEGDILSLVDRDTPSTRLLKIYPRVQIYLKAGDSLVEWIKEILKKAPAGDEIREIEFSMRQRGLTISREEIQRELELNAITQKPEIAKQVLLDLDEHCNSKDPVAQLTNDTYGLWESLPDFESLGFLFNELKLGPIAHRSGDKKGISPADLDLIIKERSSEGKQTELLTLYSSQSRKNYNKFKDQQGKSYYFLKSFYEDGVIRVFVTEGFVPPVIDEKILEPGWVSVNDLRSLLGLETEVMSRWEELWCSFLETVTKLSKFLDSKLQSKNKIFHRPLVP